MVAPYAQREHQQRWGAYGLVLNGIAPAHLIAAPAFGAPAFGAGAVGVDLYRTIAPPSLPDGEPIVGIDEHRAHLRMPEGRMDVTREPLAVRFTTSSRLLDHAVLHPYLAFPAAVIASWHGRLALHAGAVVTARGAIAILGDKGAGKSTLVATLAQLGADVLTDDLLVIEDGQAFGGPRSVDLRPDMAGAVSTVDLGVVGARSRHRYTPGAVAWSVPLAGVVHLAVGDGLAMQPVPPSARLTMLGQVAALGPTMVPLDAALGVAALPTWRLTRPRPRHGVTATPTAAPAELLLRLVA